MADRARFDQNLRNSLIAVSNADGETPVSLWADPTTHQLLVSGTGGGSGDGAILDGVNATIKATVFDLTNSNPLTVAVVDGSGNQLVSFGGGTQYTEDAVAAADPTGTMPVFVRKDTPAATVSADGDVIAQRGSNYGAIYATLLDSSGNFISVGGGTQYDEDAASAGGEKLTLAGAIRQDTIGSTTSADGDYSNLKVTSVGRLYTSTTIDAALPAGTNAIGKLATNDGVDIGDVTINNASGGSAVNIQDGGNSITVDGSVSVAGVSTLAEQQTQTTSLQLIDDIVYTDDTSTHATGTSKGALFMAAATPTDGSVNANDIGAVAMTTDRKLHVSVQDALPAGTNAIGKLAANSGVDIGDVTLNNDLGGASDVISVANTVNAIPVAQYNSVLPTVTNGRWNNLQVDVKSNLRIVNMDAAGNARGANVNASNQLSVSVDNTPAVTISSGSVTVSGTITANAGTGFPTVYTEDVASAGAEALIMAGAIRQDTIASSTSADGDYSNLKVNNVGRLYTSTTIDAALPAGTNAIGKLSANDGVDIGDVTINNASGASAVNIQDGGNSITVDFISSSAIASAVPANAVYVGMNDASGNLRGLNTADSTADGNSGVKLLSVGNYLYTGSAWSKGREIVNANNTTGTGIAAVGILAQFDDTSPTSITENQFGNIRMSANRNVYSTIRDAAGNERGLNVDSNGEIGIGAIRTSVTPGTAAANLGKAEDAGHSAGDVGVMSLAVRNDAGRVLAGTDLDYIPLTTNNTGALRVTGSLSVTNTTEGSTVADSPIAVTAEGTQLVSIAGPTGDPIDSVGNSLSVAFAKPQQVFLSDRGKKGDAYLTLTSTTTETTLIAAQSGLSDIYGLVAINTSATATQVDFRDITAGNVRFSLYLPAGDTRGFTLNESGAYKQSIRNSNWTAKCGTSVASVIISALYVVN